MDFESDIKNLQWTYQLIRLNIAKYVLDLQHMTFNYQIFTLQILYVTFKI